MNAQNPAQVPQPVGCLQCAGACREKETWAFRGAWLHSSSPQPWFPLWRGWFSSSRPPRASAWEVNDGRKVPPWDWVSPAQSGQTSPRFPGLCDGMPPLSLLFGQINLYIAQHPGQPPTHSFQPPCLGPAQPRATPRRGRDAAEGPLQWMLSCCHQHRDPGKRPRESPSPAALLRATCTAFSGSTREKFIPE